jgi:hypothetical protein
MKTVNGRDVKPRLLRPLKPVAEMAANVSDRTDTSR